LEEATIAAVNGELNPFTTGVAYCSMISSCRDTTDYRRATERTEATHRWCERQSINGFPGICRVHRAEIVARQSVSALVFHDPEHETWQTAERSVRAQVHAAGEIPSHG
jgi:hypothetical protein